jgi:hypothetical protein
MYSKDAERPDQELDAQDGGRRAVQGTFTVVHQENGVVTGKPALPTGCLLPAQSYTVAMEFPLQRRMQRFE